MKLRAILRMLSVSACLAATVAASTVVGSSASADPSAAVLERFAQAGVDVSQLEPGWSVVGDEIQWDGGDTGMTILTTAVDFSGGPCPSGYVCLFQHADLLGVMWYSNDRARYLSLSALGFNDVTSSWYNRTGYDAIWYVNGPATHPWYCMAPGDAEEHMASHLNDKASTVYIYNSSTVC